MSHWFARLLSQSNPIFQIIVSSGFVCLNTILTLLFTFKLLVQNPIVFY